MIESVRINLKKKVKRKLPIIKLLLNCENSNNFCFLLVKDPSESLVNDNHLSYFLHRRLALMTSIPRVPFILSALSNLIPFNVIEILLMFYGYHESP